MKASQDRFVNHLSERTGVSSQDTYAYAVLPLEDAADPNYLLIYHIAASKN